MYTWFECKGRSTLPDNTVAVRIRNGQVWCRTKIEDYDFDCTPQGLNSDIIEYLVCERLWLDMVLQYQREYKKMLILL